MSLSSVSVIIAVYNGAKYLAPAIESVRAQTLAPLEIVVVDDGSTDDTAQVAQSFADVSYLHQENGGMAAARNFGARKARGEFLAFLDADDLWTPDKLETQIGYLRADPAAGYAICWQRMFLEPGGALPAWLKKDLFEKDHPAFVPSALVMRRTTYDRLGQFDESLHHSSDLDWFTRAQSCEVALAIVPRVLLLRRIHESNESSRAREIFREILRIAKSGVDRQRAAQANLTTQAQTDFQP